MSEFRISRRPFASAVDGRPLVEVNLLTPTGTSAIDEWIEEQQEAAETRNGRRYDEDFVFDNLWPLAASWATSLMTAALGLTASAVDVEGMDGAMLVAAEDMPRDQRDEGTSRLRVEAKWMREDGHCPHTSSRSADPADCFACGQVDR